MRKETDTDFQHEFGKMVKGKSSLLLEGGQLTDTQNMLPGYEWEQRKGMSALTATAVATGLRFKALCQFRDLRGDTDVLLAHTYDSVGGEDLYVGDALPPSAIGWSKMYDLSAGCTKCQFANVAKAVIVANTKDFLIWRGNKYFPTGVWKYNSAPDNYVLFADELFDSDTDTAMPLNGLNTDEAFFVLSDMPLDTVNVIAGDLNATASKLTGFIWNGAWEGLSYSVVSDASLLKDDCSTLAAWDDDDVNAGVSEATTFQGRNVFRLDGNTAEAGNRAGISQDVGSFATGCSLTIVVYHQKLGDAADSDMFAGSLSDGTNVLTYRLAADGMFVFDGADWNEVGTDIVLQDTWVEYTFVVSAGFATVQIYMNGVQVGTDVDCSYAGGGTDGDVVLQQHGVTTNDMLSHVSSVKVGNTTEAGDGWADGTDLAGATIGKNGALSWTKRTDEVKTNIQGVPGYAYKFSADAVLDNPTSITGLSVHAPIGPVVDIWNNMTEPPTGCYVYDGTDYSDYTAFVNNTTESQYLDLSLVDENDKIYVGFVARVNKIKLWVAAAGKNDVDVSLTSIKYHNAAGVATTVGTVVDTTEVGSDTMLAQKGYWSWQDPGWQNEKMTIIGGDSTPMYWYEIVVDDALANPTQVYYIRGEPITKDPDPCRGVFAFKRRCWQIAPRNRENMVRFSSQDLPNTWNGSDSGYMAFGERPLHAAASFYNETLLYADTELWMLQGNSPTNFGRLRLSAKVGTNAPESVVNIESGVIVADTLKVVVAWQFFDGFWMFDGVRVWKISAPDIDTFFDEDHEDYIPQAYLDQTVGEYDYATQTVRWAVYSGSGAVTPTKVIVMHFPTLNFGIFDYATDIDAMLSVVNSKYYLVGGGYADGRFYQLDSGVTDLLNTVATAVDAFVITRDEFMGYSTGLRQRLMTIWHEANAAGGQIEVDQYPDGSKTPQNIAKAGMSVRGKIFGALQRTLETFSGQKTVKFRIRNRSKNARMKLLGMSTTVDAGRENE